MIFSETSMVLWSHQAGRRSTIAPLGQGHHSLDFTLSLPSTLTDQRNDNVYTLPPSFAYRDFPQSVQYLIEVVLEQKGLFSSDYRYFRFLFLMDASLCNHL